MNKTDMIHIRVKPDVKKDAEKILNNLGMTTGEAINIYLRQIILNKGLPFKVIIPKYSDEMLQSIEEAEEIIKHPENTKSYNNINDLMEDLNNEISD